ncbi:MAG TPA: hybrid sensor histidine kinase/response regulator, partial [Spirochaetia bacterium]|nr:hybrid sensor histidine kinase/response regulator [Spirochaetia bacterium]
MENLTEILVVDDLIENIKVIGNILKMNDYKLSIAMNGKEALSYLEDHFPDLILLDVTMPELNGFTVCEMIKKNEKLKNIPVIFLTAKVESEDILRGFQAGGVDYITKPFNHDELLSRVKTHIELKKSKDLILEQNEKLEKMNQEKNKFFSIIAHDIRNPVTAIFGFADLLKNKINEMSDQERKKSIDILYQSSVQLADLIEHLLDWVKMQINKTDFKPVLFFLKKEVLKVFQFQQLQADMKKIKLYENISENTEIKADLNMFRSILINLVSNALKFTPENGEVKVEAFSDEKELRVSVMDNGIGMEPEIINKLFQLGSQHTTWGTADEKGTGLGLLLCRE